MTASDYFEPFEPDYTHRVIGRGFAPISDRYFRARIIGADRIPTTGPLVLAPNHSGSAFPFDAMVLDALLWRLDGYRPKAKFRSVYEKELSTTWWMRPFGIDNFWRRCGGVDMTFDNFHELLARGERVIYYPEGVPGIGKGFRRRYQLQPFHTSFLIHCARNRAPVLPLYIVNAEWVNPFNFTIGWLNRLTQRMFHVPFLPLPSALLGILWPWCWYLAFPCRMTFVVGEPIDVVSRMRAAGVERLERSEHGKLREVADQIRREMQPELDRYVRRYGTRPYQCRSLGRELWRGRRRLANILPIGWTAVFVKLHRNTMRPRARSRLVRWLRDWDLIGFYLPLGWPLLTLTRAWRKPPYGFRGLSPEARREREGSYVWRLSERPLPPRAAMGEALADGSGATEV